MATMLKYVSEGGTVRMNGPLSNMRITQITGLELPQKDYEELEFAGENGVTMIGSKDRKRTIHIAGDISSEQKAVQKILKVFYYPGTLYCEFGSAKRRIECKPMQISDAERQGKSGIAGLVVQLQADDPYFRDEKDSEVPISGTRDLIEEGFTLPCVWTEWIQGGTVSNHGDIPVFPIVEITAENHTDTEAATITVENVTTGARLALDYVMQEGERVTVDLAGRRIKSSLNGTITNRITDETVLSEFFLKVGENSLRFSTTAEDQILRAVVIFSRLYLTAVR